MSQDYNNTLSLPKTEFPMRAGLPQREPKMLEEWEANRLYYKIVEKNKGKPLYSLHDGPPYANATIHMGTALNKVLKDLVMRSRNLMGYYAPYVPGWDTHGLPIELKAMQQIGPHAHPDPLELRRICYDFAIKHVEIQKGQFKRLGTLADYDNPYLTLTHDFEARQIEIFGAMMKKGYIYKGLKPVYWCADCLTALAEAEIEYQDDPCESIYVKFQLKEGNDTLAAMGCTPANTYFVIWTTTTWTLPGNMAISLHPAIEYAAVKVGEEYLIMAKSLVDNVMARAGISEYSIAGTCKGIDLDRLAARHPFIDRDSFIMVGDHVTADDGTGCVHTAPGHGMDDFIVFKKYFPDMPMEMPVDEHGVFDAGAGQFAGLNINKAHEPIVEQLKSTGNYLAGYSFVHSYPHCWRCKKPVIYRATQQWFCSIDQFKDEAVKAVEDVEWIPGWGKDRMRGMIADRSDWCISRQRVWGVPIPVFYCESCGEYHADDTSIGAVVELFRKEGADGWYTHTAEEILPTGTACKHCGHTHFHKETDIMDVWFDSGCTHASVLEREGLEWPCDLYLEGGDQFRGWFQSSLLTAVAWRGIAPYRAVCTHGWVVDGEGKKQSKSLGNGVDPDEICDEYGADILRLWVTSSDYHSDIRLSKEILKQLSEIYRKLRNTARFILGNLYDFDPVKDSVPLDQVQGIHKWALLRCDELIRLAREAYTGFEFYRIYHALYNFCTVDMSNFYLDVLKDTLYVEAPESEARRTAQTVIYRILRELTLVMAPIISFTAEEIWSYLPADERYDADSVMLNVMPDPADHGDEAGFMADFERIIAVRDDVNKALELARAAKTIGKSLEAKTVLYADGELYDLLMRFTDSLDKLFIVSAVEVVKGEGGTAGELAGLGVTVEEASGGKCERCWVYSDTVGNSEKHPTLCKRCADILG